MDDNDPLARARAVAKEEAALAKEWDTASEEHAVDTWYAGASAHDLIKMYETGKTLEGRKINAFESRALVSAWLQRFGYYPTQGAPKQAGAIADSW